MEKTDFDFKKFIGMISDFSIKVRPYRPIKTLQEEFSLSHVFFHGFKT